MQSELTDQAYWDRFWKGPLASASHLSYFYRAMGQLLRTHCPAGGSALEVGCGGSVWVPTLSRAGCDSWGIDYSEVGVAKAQQLLDRWGARATLVHGDVFDRHALPAEAFDLVYSLGLFEHFTDSGGYVQRLRELCRPGGRVVTTVPNLTGAWGSLQRRLDAAVYDTHRVVTPEALDQAHLDAGFEIVEPARYFGGIAPLIVHYEPLLRPLPRPVARAVLGGIWTTQQLLGWSLSPLPDRIASPPLLAAHVVGVYRDAR